MCARKMFPGLTSSAITTFLVSIIHYTVLCYSVVWSLGLALYSELGKVDLEVWWSETLPNTPTKNGDSGWAVCKTVLYKFVFVTSLQHLKHIYIIAGTVDESSSKSMQIQVPLVLIIVQSVRASSFSPRRIQIYTR